MARSGFPGFSKDLAAFFRGLARNNHREWFLPRKPVFEEKVKEPMRQLVEALNMEIRRFAPLHITDPDKSIYRIYRDTRFSQDKKPYKEHLAAYFPRQGIGRDGGAGYYLAVSHKSLAVGGGVHMPTPEMLRTLRNHIAERPAEFRRLAGSKTLRKLFGEMHGDQLSRVPKGFAADHPAADLLRYKQYLFYVELPADLVTSPELFGEVRTRFRALTPLVDFLNAPLVAARPKTRVEDLL
ncbi:MAG: DUF2461 domain-containing protein [Bryobacteraceae bacterium]|jgi:uncharacterized protein (TIGR02453 family)